jgi:hypothetical protein
MYLWFLINKVSPWWLLKKKSSRSFPYEPKFLYVLTMNNSCMYTHVYIYQMHPYVSQMISHILTCIPYPMEKLWAMAGHRSHRNACSSGQVRACVKISLRTFVFVLSPVSCACPYFLNIFFSWDTSITNPMPMIDLASSIKSDIIVRPIYHRSKLLTMILSQAGYAQQKLFVYSHGIACSTPYIAIHARSEILHHKFKISTQFM